MTSQIEAQRVRRWQDEVARDPGSLSFLPLADVYRKEGRLAVALRLPPELTAERVARSRPRRGPRPAGSHLPGAG